MIWGDLPQFLRVWILSSQKDYFIFYGLHRGKQILLLVYVDNIVIIDDDTQGISELKLYNKVSKQRFKIVVIFLEY